MAQVGNQHPDKLVPYWHAARQLTPAEAEAVGRIMSEQAERYIAERETMVAEWLERLPAIPPRRSERDKWSLELPSDVSSYYYNFVQANAHVSAVKSAIRAGDLRKLLRLVTDSQPFVPHQKLGDSRPAWQRTLQGIRDSLEARIDDALEAAAMAKAAETA